MTNIKRAFLIVCILNLISFYIFAEDAYLMSYFNGGDGKEALYLAYSYDAIHWTPINENKPVLFATVGNKSIRDPFLYRKQDGKFVLLSTDSWTSENIIIWDSEDLINFKNERMIRVNNLGQHAWAPECIYDPQTKKYIIFWSGNIIYCNTTSDFKSVTPTEKYFDPGYICIDANIVSHQNEYFLFYKDERGANSDTTKFKGLKIAKSKTLKPGSFTIITPQYITDHLVEGPACLKSLTEEKWYLYYDYFMQNGFWGCSYTTKLNSGKWTKMATSEYKLPDGVRHGNALKVSDAELNKIINYHKK